MGLTTKGRDQSADLNAAFAYIEREAVADVLGIAGALGSGTRYAREIAATLVRLGVATERDEAGTFEVVEGADLEAALDSMSADDATEDLDTKPATRVGNLVKCLCGCGAYTNHPKSSFLPGHDARMAGNVARAIANHAGVPGGDWEDELLATLPSQALRVKAAAHAARLRAKGTATAAPKVETGTVKIGRWTYGATRENGVVTYRLKDAREVRQATEKQAATFTPNA